MAALSAATTEMLSAVSEVSLVAPDGIGRQADQAAHWLSDHALDVEHGSIRTASNEELGEIRKKLYQAMRADLGEPV